jgi:RNA polymerase sigma factor (sigma-70 family)
MGRMTGAPQGDADAGGESAAPEQSRSQRAAGAFARWRAGDDRAMDDLVREMTPVLWHVARAYGVDSALAQDIVQTTWMTLLRRHESIADPHAVSAWLATCTRREAWRVRKLERRAEPTEHDDLEPRLPVGDSAEQLAARGDGVRRLWAAVRELDERCQRLLRVIAFDERPDYARIARDMAMPVGSIGPTRGRCLGKLRTLLERGGWDGADHGL